MTLTAFLLFCLLTGLFWPEGQAILQEILWPGDAAATRQALSNLLQQLRWGEPFSDAIEVFCTAVLHGN